MDVFVCAIARVDHAPSCRRNSILDQYGVFGRTVFTRLDAWLGRNGAGGLNGGSDRGVGTKEYQHWILQSWAGPMFKKKKKKSVAKTKDENKGIMIQHTTVEIDHGLL